MIGEHGLLNHTVIEILGWTLLHFCWQGVVIAAGLMIVLLGLRKSSANARYVASLTALGFAAFAMIGTATWLSLTRPPAITPHEDSANQPPVSAIDGTAVETEIPNELNPLPTKVESIEEATPAPVSPTLASNRDEAVETTQPSSQTKVSAQPPQKRIVDYVRAFLPWCVAAWFVGICVLSVRLMVAWTRAQRLRRVGLVPANSALLNGFPRLCERLGVSPDSVSLLGSKCVDVPTVIGWFRPLVLFPVGSLTGLTPLQVESLLAHELAHIRRRDYAINLIQTVVETALFYHPAVWWISRQIRTERENCCDDLAAGVCADEIGYVKALLQIAELRTRTHRVSLAANNGDLLTRAKRLLPGASPASFAPGSSGIILMIAILVTAMLGLIRWENARADQTATEPNEEEVANESVDFENLTPAKVLANVQATMDQFKRVSYSATFTETRNANAFVKKDVLPVKGQGRWEFRTDGNHWRALREGFTIRFGEPEAIPTKTLSGFDGKYLYTEDRGTFIIGEESSAHETLAPRSVFWNGGRTVGWFVAALKSWNARIDREVTINDKRCIVIVSQPGKKNPSDLMPNEDNPVKWNYEITLSPTQSWLPLKTTVTYQGKPYAEETLSELTRSEQGVWYPGKIVRKQIQQPDTLIAKETRITELEAAPKFTTDAFAMKYPLNQDIVNYSTGQTWRNGPMWSGMETWLRKELNWPRPPRRYLSDLKSYVKDGIDGQSAPPISARDWLGKNPGEWPQNGKKIRVLFFLGGRAILPTPRWVAALRSLQNQYREDGLQIIGITTGTADRKLVEQAYQTLRPGFPWAIDTAVEEKGSFGKTFDAYKLRHYAGVLIVDQNNTIRTLESIKVPSGSQLSPLEFAIRQALEMDTKNYRPPAESLSRAEFDRIETEWKRRLKAKIGQAELRGKIRINVEGRDVFGELPIKTTTPNVPVTIKLIPTLQILSSNTPGGWHVFLDHQNSIEEEFASDRDWTIGDLKEGNYRMTIRPRGLAAIETTVTIPTHDAKVNRTWEFHQGDTIRGTIVQTDGKPVPGAVISSPRRYFDPNSLKRYTTGQLPAKTTTDNQGHFEIKNLYIGAYQLQISAEGYQTQTVNAVPAGKIGMKIVLRKVGEAAGVTQSARKPPVELTCRMQDSKTKKPIPNVKVRWEPFGTEAKKLDWKFETKTDQNGQYTIRIPQDVADRLGYHIQVSTEHSDYLPVNGGYRIRKMAGGELELQDFFHNLGLTRGKEVTGRFLNPDGSPAKNMTVMIGDNRDGFEDGLGIGYYTKTDDDGRFRLLTKSRWPQRVSWFPKEYAANSKAVTKTFGDQGTLRIKSGYILKGQVVSYDGEPQVGIGIRATNGTRIPRRYTKTDKNGNFVFAPLPKGKYALSIVRSYQDHHRRGEWENLDRPVPFPVAFQELDGNSNPITIRGPETIRIQIEVVDGTGKPLPDQRIAIGQTGDYRNALIAKPIPEKPGEYEFQYPEGKYIRDIVLRHSWDEVAFYQETPNSEPIPGTMLVLGKAEEDISGITIHVRKAGKLRVRVKTDDGQPVPPRVNISTNYNKTYPKSRVRFGTGIVQSRSPKVDYTEIKPLAPDEPFMLTVKAMGYQTVTQDLQLADGETKTLDVTLTPMD